jgi:hypothetical protein
MFKKSIKPLSILLSAVVIMGGVFYITKFAHANSIIVDSNTDVVADDGVCTLREAIEKANDTVTGDPHGFVLPGECGVGDPAGLDTITFSSAVFPATITLASTLPAIITPVIIDGISGIPGLSCGDITTPTPKTLGVEIDATAAHVGLNISGAGSTGSKVNGINIRTDNQGVGVGLEIDGGATNISLTCSIIGLDVTGISPKGFDVGVQVRNSFNITVGGSNPGEGNVISGNFNTVFDGSGNFQVYIYNSDDTIIEGNIIGLNMIGDTGFPIQSAGINLVDSQNVRIGGPNPQQRNIISGIEDSSGGGVGIGIDLAGVSDSFIQGNYIGTDILGLTVAGNNGQGIRACDNDTTGSCGTAVSGTNNTNITVGGSNPGEGNVISGNQTGLTIEEPETWIITGNYFGLDKDGLNPIANSALGVQLLAEPGEEGHNVTIGGVGPNERNIFAGNSIAGITENYILNYSIINNYFGVDKNGTTSIPNGFGGIGLFGGQGVVGGTIPAEGNIIANGGIFGVVCVGCSALTSNNTIYGNTVGVVSNASVDIVGFPNPTNHVVINNKIFNNSQLGIDLAYDSSGGTLPDTNIGVNLNDISDSDSGANGYLNYPVIHSITESPLGTLNINYYLDAPVGSYRVEFYKNPTAGLDSSYHGEGEQFVFADTFTSSGTIGVKTVTFPGSLTDIITPTATECTDGTCTAFVRTSEFGPTVPITAGGGSGAGLDFGDVTTNQTTALSNGAYHILNTNYLGSCIDADTGTVQNAIATTDDTTAPTDPSAVVGVCATPNDDEDGVTFDKATYTTGDSAILTVTASAPGIVNVWVDTNTNGSFLDVGEQVLVNTAVVAGPNTMTGFTVPAANGIYPLRVRYVSDISKIYQESPGVASPRGEALDGEVEDYNLQVGPVVVPPTPPSGGGGSSGGYQGDICLNLSGTQFLVPSGYIKDTTGLIPGACAPVTVDPTDPKKYTVDVYPLNETGDIKNPTSTSCPYFTQYLKLGKKTDSTEVIKWQNFLNTHMKEKLEVTGVYDVLTYNAVKRFQANYKADVLTPWGLKNPTGWTYKTTRMKANQIVGCLEKPVYLEIPGISWVLGVLKK